MVTHTMLPSFWSLISSTVILCLYISTQFNSVASENQNTRRYRSFDLKTINQFKLQNDRRNQFDRYDKISVNNIEADTRDINNYRYRYQERRSVRQNVENLQSNNRRRLENQRENRRVELQFDKPNSRHVFDSNSRNIENRQLLTDKRVRNEFKRLPYWQNSRRIRNNNIEISSLENRHFIERNEYGKYAVKRETIPLTDNNERINNYKRESSNFGIQFNNEQRNRRNANNEQSIRYEKDGIRNELQSDRNIRSRNLRTTSIADTSNQCSRDNSRKERQDNRRIVDDTRRVNQRHDQIRNTNENDRRTRETRHVDNRFRTTRNAQFTRNERRVYDFEFNNAQRNQQNLNNDRRLYSIRQKRDQRSDLLRYNGNIRSDNSDNLPNLSSTQRGHENVRNEQNEYRSFDDSKRIMRREYIRYTNENDRRKMEVQREARINLGTKRYERNERSIFDSSSYLLERENNNDRKILRENLLQKDRREIQERSRNERRVNYQQNNRQNERRLIGRFTLRQVEENQGKSNKVDNDRRRLIKDFRRIVETQRLHIKDVNRRTEQQRDARRYIRKLRDARDTHLNRIEQSYKISNNKPELLIQSVIPKKLYNSNTFAWQMCQAILIGAVLIEIIRKQSHMKESNRIYRFKNAISSLSSNMAIKFKMM